MFRVITTARKELIDKHFRIHKYYRTEDDKLAFENNVCKISMRIENGIKI